MAQAALLLALESMGDGFAAMDFEGRYTLVNPAYAKFAGRSREQLIGQLLWEIFPEVRGSPSGLAYERAMRDRIPQQAEEYFPALDLWLEVRISPSPQGLAVLVRDVTQCRRAHQALCEQNETAETLNRVGRIIATQLELEMLVQEVIDAATRLTGAEFGAFFYNATDGRGEPRLLHAISGVPRELFSQLPRLRNTAILAPTFDGAEVVRLDDVTQDPRYGQLAPYPGMPQGHLPVKSYLAVPVNSRSGEVLGELFLGHSSAAVFTQRSENFVVGLAAQAAVAMDNARLFQETKQAKELQTRRARQAALGADVGAALTRGQQLRGMLQQCAEAMVRHLDAAFARIWTLSPREHVLELQASAGLYTHIDGPHARVPVGKFKIGRIAEQKQPHLTNDVLTDPQLSNPEWARREGMVSFAGYPLILGDRVVGVMAMFAREPLVQDTLEALASVADSVALGIQRLRSDEEREQLIRALERSNAELDQFAYVASHDLRAPLRGIANISQWMEEDLGSAINGPAREQLDLLRGRVMRMEALINGILDYSRAGRTRHKMEVVDVRRMVQEVVDLLAPKPGITIELGSDFPTLSTERVPLQQVFLNLIGNAIKHARREDAVVWLTASDVGACIQFTVRDNGRGIAPEFHDRIWGLFQTLEAQDAVDSTGIGLSVVKKTVESRGGKAWVESAPLQGAAFHFTWPKLL